MKSFKPNPWVAPQPVLIIGTYDANGNANAMNAAWGGQWDANEIVISMGAHATTENLDNCGDFTVAFATVDTMVAADFVGLVSAKKDKEKMKNIIQKNFYYLFMKFLKKLSPQSLRKYFFLEKTGMV